MKKRTAFILLASLMIMSIAAACGSPANNDATTAASEAAKTKAEAPASTTKAPETTTEAPATTTKTSETTTKAPATAKAAETSPNVAADAAKEIIWWVGHTNDGGFDWDTVYKEAAGYVLKTLNIKVDFKWMDDWQQARERFPIMIAAGEDLGVMPFTSYGVDYLREALSGAFTPMDDLLAQYAQGTKALFPDKIWDAMRVKGIIYGVPTNRDNCVIESAVYNVEMAEKLGIDMSKYTTWTNIMDKEDLLNEIWEKRRELMPEWGEHAIMLGMPVPQSTFAMEQPIGNFLAAVYNYPDINDFPGKDKDTVFNMYETPEYYEYIKMAARLAKAGIIPTDAVDQIKTDGGFFFETLTGWIIVDETHWKSENPESVLVKHMPAARNWTDTFSYQVAGVAISSMTKEPEACMRAIELMNTDSFLATLVRFGVEGIHWNYDANGKMVQTDPITYQNWYGAFIGNVMVVNAPEKFAGPNNEFFTILQASNKNASTNHMGFMMDTESVENELTALRAVIAEYDTTLRGLLKDESAAVTLADEFNAKLYANGLQKVHDEVTRQLDVWKSEN